MLKRYPKCGTDPFKQVHRVIMAAGWMRLCNAMAVYGTTG